jgi:hypothetical protein
VTFRKLRLKVCSGPCADYVRAATGPNNGHAGRSLLLQQIKAAYEAGRVSTPTKE